MESLSIHKKIAVLRKMRGLKRSQFAEILGVSDDAIRTWEKGSRTPDSFHLLALADALNVSLDVFRDDATTLDLPRPDFGSAAAESPKNEETAFDGVPLRFGSSEPDTKQKEILDFCSAYLETLDDSFFIKGAGQNSEYGTGRYFWESQIDMLLFIGFVPDFEKNHPEYAFSISVNTENPLDAEDLSGFNALQIRESEYENWIYLPVKCPLKKDGAFYPKELREACDKALVDAMKIARKSLERTMERFISQKAAENQTKFGKFAH